MIKAIVFDFYRVVTKENWSDCVARELSRRLGLGSTEIKQAFKKYHQPFARAEISPTEFLEKFIGSMDKERNPSDFKYLFDIIPELNYGLLELVLRLRKSHKTALFSNNFAPVFPNYRKSINLDDYFDYVFLSYELKLNKIHVEIWDVILERMGFRPNQVLFIDDNEKYNGIAEKRGINTILFRNNGQLKKEISHYSVNTD